MRCSAALRPLGRGWAGPRAVKCFCWLVRGKPRQPVTGGRVGSGAAQPGGARERAESARSWRGHRPMGREWVFSGAAPGRPLPPWVVCLISTRPSTHHCSSQYHAFGCQVVPGDCTHAGVYLAAAASAFGLSFEEYLCFIDLFILLASRLRGHYFA